MVHDRFVDDLHVFYMYMCTCKVLRSLSNDIQYICVHDAVSYTCTLYVTVSGERGHSVQNVHVHVHSIYERL